LVLFSAKFVSAGVFRNCAENFHFEALGEHDLPEYLAMNVREASSIPTGTPDRYILARRCSKEKIHEYIFGSKMYAQAGQR
jgi:hypothetical protein